jgi:general secretion pathway protein I
MKSGASAGFSVIETLVAVAILAIALIPILMLQSETSRASLRETQIRASITDQQNALALLADINPMQAPSGQIAMSPTRLVSWRALPLSPVTPAIVRADAQTSFEAALYRLQVEIRDTHGVRQGSFVVDQMGWRTVSAPAQ